jgi:type III pantothenate kinase
MPVSSWLAIDVGNSRIKFGLFKAETPHDTPGTDCVDVISTSLDEQPPWSELVARIDESLDAPVNCVVAGSNQAGVSQVISNWPADHLQRPQIISDGLQFPLEINVDQPDRVGLDRLLNAIAANAIRSNDWPTIIIDCGTATTVDLVAGEGTFEGGAILPGFDLSARALNLYTEALPLFTMNQLVGDSNTPPIPVGKNTEAAIASGIYWSQIGAVREMVTQVSSGLDNYNLIVTGGGSHLLAQHFAAAIRIPHLGLSGLVLVAQQK